MMIDEKDLQGSMQEENQDAVGQEESIDQNEESIEAFLKEQEDDSDRYAAEVSLWKDQCKRISAEFENFKKRNERDQLRWVELSKEKIFKEILPIVDDFSRALKQEGSSNEGLLLMQQSFIKFLQKNGVIMMQDYETFNPEFHDAVMQVESPEHVSGQIVEVFAQGFMMQDKVLRPAQVSVAK